MMRKKKRDPDRDIIARANSPDHQDELAQTMMDIASKVCSFMPAQTDFVLMVYPLGISNSASGFVSTTRDLTAIISAVRKQTHDLQESLLVGATFGHA